VHWLLKFLHVLEIDQGLLASTHHKRGQGLPKFLGVNI